MHTTATTQNRRRLGLCQPFKLPVPALARDPHLPHPSPFPDLQWRVSSLHDVVCEFPVHGKACAVSVPVVPVALSTLSTLALHWQSTEKKKAELPTVPRCLARRGGTEPSRARAPNQAARTSAKAFALAWLGLPAAAAVVALRA